MTTRFFVGLFALTLQAAMGLAQDTTHVLFIGNSFTYFNNMPTLFEGLATAQGKLVYTEMYAPGGVSVGDISQGTQAHMNNPLVFDKIRNRAWDVMVIQDNQGRFVFDSAQFPSTAVSLVVEGHFKLMDSLHHYRPCARVVLFGGWGVKTGMPPYGNTGEEMIRRILCNYRVLNDTLHEVISPIGEAWITSLHRLPGTDLWANDETHPSLAGSYLTAATLCTTLWPESLAGNAYKGGLAGSVADSLLAFASETGASPVLQTAYSTTAMQPLAVAVSDSFLEAPANGQAYWWFRGDSLIASGQSVIIADTSAFYRLEMVDALGVYHKSCSIWVEVVPPNGVDTQAGTWAIGPNPASDWLTVRSPAEARLTICNALGQVVLRQPLVVGVNTVNISTLPAGYYTVAALGRIQKVAIAPH
jgi:hypothetical protein